MCVQLFGEVANDPNLKEASLQLFMNKSDLFGDVIKKYSLSVVPEFSDYSGGHDFDAAIEYIKKKFASQLRERSKESFRPYVTCATDSDKFHYLIKECQQHILIKNLESAGLLTGRRDEED